MYFFTILEIEYIVLNDLVQDTRGGEATASASVLEVS
jgi:hypothetical protein